MSLRFSQFFEPRSAYKIPARLHATHFIFDWLEIVPPQINLHSHVMHINFS